MTRSLTDIMREFEECNAELQFLNFEIQHSDSITREQYREKERITKKIAKLADEMPSIIGN